jgi:hypothetical protein
VFGVLSAGEEGGEWGDLRMGLFPWLFWRFGLGDVLWEEEGWIAIISVGSGAGIERDLSVRGRLGTSLGISGRFE